MPAFLLRRTRCRQNRSGAIIVLVAVLMVAMFAMLAVSIDVGYVATCRTELVRASDAGALAGAAVLADGLAEAEAAARQFIKANIVGARPVEDSEITIETGNWDPGGRTFTPSEVLPSAIRVTTVRPSQPYFFARVLGHDTFDLTSHSVAVYQPHRKVSNQSNRRRLPLYSAGKQPRGSSVPATAAGVQSPRFALSFRTWPACCRLDRTATLKLRLWRYLLRPTLVRRLCGNGLPDAYHGKQSRFGESWHTGRWPGRHSAEYRQRGV